jgi:CheY-like chemotaxis protein
MKKILIVDDNPQDLSLLHNLLNRHGYGVTAAANGVEALEKARSKRPDMIISDILMPIMDGFTLCREWKRDGRLKDVPFMFFSSTYNDPKDEKFAMGLGAERFIIKPQKQEVLLGIIEEVISEHKAGRLVAPSEPQRDEAVSLREYNEVLIRKLEDKMVQIEEANRRLELEVAERKRAEEALALQIRIATIFLTAPDEETFNEVLKVVMDVMHSPFGVFGYLDEDGAHVVSTMTRQGWDKCQVPEKTIRFPRETWGDSSWPRAYLEKKANYSNEPSINTSEGHVAIHRHISMPILLQGEAIGLFQVANKETDYTEADLRTLEIIAGHVAPVLDARLHGQRAEKESTRLKAQLQQAQKLESLGVLAGGIAHDFNNILMAVLGHSELALDQISPMSAARMSLTEISKASRRAAELCTQMLAYAGKASFALERVGLRELVEEMAHLLKTAISKKAILNLNLERDLPPIEADPSQIRQIVMNLIINASEAIGDRSGVITVSVGATRCDEEYLQKTELLNDLAPGVYAHLEVTDTGGGMDAETRARIFEPFFTTKFAGRGLGLAAVLGIVRAHKGALKVYSEPGKGTTFKVLFPALEDAGEEARTHGSSSLADWRGKGTILLVDDEESLLALGARMLEHLGLTVLTAADGLQAVELYREREKEIDLVLMDLTMPHMDGASALGELRRLNPDVRVVLASGYSREDVASRFAGKGLDGVLQKPYTFLKLRESLAGLMPARSTGDG